MAGPLPGIFAALLIGFALCAGPCGATILYSVNAGWLFPGGDEGNLFHGQSTTPTSVTSGGDFSRHGALCPASSTPSAPSCSITSSRRRVTRMPAPRSAGSPM
jgi:hypothetical protein